MVWEYSVPVPCRIGDKVFSIIGEKVHSYVVDGYRIDKDGTCLIAEDVFIGMNNMGKYYFFDEQEANEAFARMQSREHENDR